MRSKLVYGSEAEAMADLHDDPHAPVTASVVPNTDGGDGFVLQTDDNDGAERQNQARREDGLAEVWQIS